jgi:hypothetical protein
MTNEQRQELAGLEMQMRRAENHLLMRAIGTNTPDSLKVAADEYKAANRAYRDKNREYKSV